MACPSSDTDITEKERATLNLYHKLLDAIPGLEDQLSWTFEFRSRHVTTLATFVSIICHSIHPILLNSRWQIDKSATKGRTDDCGSLCKNGLKYIPKVPGYPTLEFNTKKEKHGFNHPVTGRLLCPRFLLDDFDTNPKEFCCGVRNGTRAITHDDWPAYLYPKEGYDPKVIDNNLLQGPFLLSVHHFFFFFFTTDNLCRFTVTSLLEPALWWRLPQGSLPGRNLFQICMTWMRPRPRA